MGFTVFLNAIGEGLETPIFGLADLTTVFLKQGTEGLQKAFDLLGRNVLACQEHVLIERHDVPFLLSLLQREASHGRFRRKAQEKALESGDTGGRRLSLPHINAVLRSASDRSGC
jgi:hypothetical protein